MFEGMVCECCAVISDHDFLEKSPECLAAAVDSGGHGEAAADEELRQQVPCSFDGSGDELWKEGDEGEPGDEVASGLQLSAVDIDGGADGLEGVEADTYGQYEVESGCGGAEASKCQCIIE